MKTPDIPSNEPERLRALCALEVLDTPAESRFDRITRVAQRHFQVPIALVSLVDAGRQWFKSRQGLDDAETPRDISFCGHAILSEDIFYIPNALDDPRFADNPLVTGAPHIRFYAGAPLHAPGGERVGTLCIIDPRPRELSAEDLAMLRDLADGVEAELERSHLLQAEVALAAKSQLLRDTFENMGQGISVVDRELRMVGWNRRFLELLDFPESLFHEGTRFEDVIRFNALRGEYGPGDAEEQVRARVELARRFEPHCIERIRPDGKVLEVRGQALADGGFVTTYTDITERRRAEEELRQFKTSLDLIHDCVFMFRPDTLRFFYANRGAMEQVGYGIDELQQMSPLDIKPQFDEAGFRAMIAPLLSGDKECITFETVHRHKDGHLIPVEIFLQYVAPANEPSRLVAIVRDITERKRIEAQLQLQATALDAAANSIVITDRDGTIRWVNHAFTRLTGYSREEAIGQNPRLLNSGEQDAVFFRGMYQTILAGSVWRGELVNRYKDGRLGDEEMTITPLRGDGDAITHFIAIKQDITERKKVERMKNEFVSTVSHELRTPLTSIRGALGLLLGKHGAALPEKGRQLLEMANRNSERLTLLINDILDLEKLESGSLEFEFKALDLGALAQHALGVNEGYAHQHGVRLRLTEVPQGAAVRGDEHRLLQVFANLLSNAIKYSPKEGEVVVSVSRRDTRYRVSVKDHGRGIPAEFRSRMFQRFAQADSSDTREKGGTGLGLSVTKAIVERHGGSIDYVSEVGVGTEFFFELPAWEETVIGAQGKEGRPLLLICEDNADVARVLVELLAREGLASDIAATAAGAKSLLAERRYQALVLDLSLPDQDGLELIRELRAQEHTRDVPIIVVSGRASEGRAAWEGDALAVVDWLQKPVDEARLAHAVRQALAGCARPRILHVEDDPDVVQVTQALLDGTAEYVYATTLAEARRQLAGERFDLVLLDLMLPDGSGLELLEELKGRVPVVLFSGLEPGRGLSEQVTAALVKTRTSNEQLLETIKRTIQQKVM